MAERNLDIFSTYLRGLPESGPAGRSGTEPLLGVLFNHTEPMKYRDLWKAAWLLGYSADEFATAYRALRSTGAVQVTSSEVAETTVQLTPLGRSVAAVEGRGR
jgi:hypothetical protein